MSINRSCSSRQYSPGRLGSAAAAFLLAGSAAPFLGACSSPDDYVYCVDHNGQVIDDRYCDNNANYGGYPTFLWASPHHYSTGYIVLPADRSGPKFFANTPAARSRVGLPPTGRVSGTRISGGIGHGDSSGHGS